MRLTDKARFRWTNKPSEINFKIFQEGKHVANHLSNSSLLTSKTKFFKLLRQLNESLKRRYIESSMFTSAKDFSLETYCLHKNK